MRKQIEAITCDLCEDLIESSKGKLLFRWRKGKIHKLKIEGREEMEICEHCKRAVDTYLELHW